MTKPAPVARQDTPGAEFRLTRTGVAWIQHLQRDGLGWENIYVFLRKRGMADGRHKRVIRRYVLGLSSYTKRYGT